eukprot:5814262-Alexandrium_andersonii.AAC.1
MRVGPGFFHLVASVDARLQGLRMCLMSAQIASDRKEGKDVKDAFRAGEGWEAGWSWCLLGWGGPLHRTSPRKHMGLVFTHPRAFVLVGRTSACVRCVFWR